MSKVNLLQETLAELANHQKTPMDVTCVGIKDQYVTWEDFAKAADHTYDNGFGGNEVNLRLVVVGDDWWLERGEYDGSEWWNFKSHPGYHEPNTTTFEVFNPYWWEEQ